MVTQQAGGGYYINIDEIQNSAIDAFDKINIFLNEEDLSSVFCSELIAETYQNQGILNEPPKGLPSNEYTQKDFGEEGKLALTGTVFFGREI